jgi:hypothetical protein
MRWMRWCWYGKAPRWLQRASWSWHFVACAVRLRGRKPLSSSEGDDRAYMQLQLQRLDQPAAPGRGFSLVQQAAGLSKRPRRQRVEVVILSRNDPVSGMRVFRSAQHYGLPIERGSFTRGQPPWRYLKPLRPTCSCRPT